jgi:hypothetical protein
VEDAPVADEQKSSGAMVKIITMIFGAIIAPITVALSINYLKPPSNTVVVLPHGNDKGASEATKPPADGKKPEADIPSGFGHEIKVPLPSREGSTPLVQFLTPNMNQHFYSYSYVPDHKEYALSGTVDERLFQFQPKQLQIPGKQLGVLVTRNEYQNYFLTLEYKWGEKTYPPNEEKARRCGILLHANDAEGLTPDGSIPAVLCKLQEGVTGDLLMQGEFNKVSATFRLADPPAEGMKKGHYYDPDGSKALIASGVIGAGVVHRIGTRGIALLDVKGFHTDGDLEQPGAWNKLECICDGADIRIRLNDKEVNACTQVNPTKGKIALLSNNAEITFRRFELLQLRK